MPNYKLKFTETITGTIDVQAKNLDELSKIVDDYITDLDQWNRTETDYSFDISPEVLGIE